MRDSTAKRLFTSALLLYPPAYRQEYGKEMTNVFLMQLADEKYRTWFTVRSLMNVIRTGLSQQEHVLLGLALLAIGLIVTYDQSLHSLSQSGFFLGIGLGILLLLTSIGIFLQKRWALYSWTPIGVYIIAISAQSFFWLIVGARYNAAHGFSAFSGNFLLGMIITTIQVAVIVLVTWFLSEQLKLANRHSDH